MKAGKYRFEMLPPGETLRLAWPTPARGLFDAPERYFAATRANPRYGRPGWTRECGKRFHRGCDIAPVDFTATGHYARVWFTDCASGREYESHEPVLVPHDPVFCVYDGRVEEAVTEEARSDFGLHVVVRHTWPGSGEAFFTLYGHLAEVDVTGGEVVAAPHRIGRMGRTSRSADARNWMAIAPHLHFEAWDAQRRPYDPAEFLERFLEAAPAPPGR